MIIGVSKEAFTNFQDIVKIEPSDPREPSNNSHPFRRFLQRNIPFMRKRYEAMCQIYEVSSTIAANQAIQEYSKQKVT